MIVLEMTMNMNAVNVLEATIKNNGAKWVWCGCGQWLLEDYIDKVMTEEDGTRQNVFKLCFVTLLSRKTHC